MLHNGAGELFCGRVPKLSGHVQHILSHALGKFEEQNKVLWPYVIIIIIIIIMHITTLLYN
jgi:hypothetical protein